MSDSWWKDAGEEERRRWESADLWSEHDLSALCCGLVPGRARPCTDALNDAGEAIRRAILAKVLPVIEPRDATDGDYMYGHARFFRPAAAIPWAATRFSEFPLGRRGDAASVLPAWPWGVYETQKLRLLAQAVERFWVRYDPADQTTAPTNEDVISWLVQQGLATRAAEKAAALIRADDVRPGPRR